MAAPVANLTKRGYLMGAGSLVIFSLVVVFGLKHTSSARVSTLTASTVPTSHIRNGSILDKIANQTLGVSTIQLAAYDACLL